MGEGRSANGATELAVTRFCTRLDQPELGFGDVEVASDLLRSLPQEIEAPEDVAVALGQALENSHADFGVLVLDGLAFGVGRAVGQGESGIDGHLAAARIHDAADETRGLAADDRAHLSHQSLGLTQFAALDGLDDHKEDIADAVVEILEAELAREKEAHTLGAERVESSIAVGSLLRISFCSGCSTGRGRSSGDCRGTVSAAGGGTRPGSQPGGSGG